MKGHQILALPDSPEINASHYIDEEEFIAVVVPDNLAGERLDKVLAQLIPQHSRNRLQSWIEGGFVTLAGSPLKIRYSVSAGDHIMVLPQASADDQEPTEITISTWSSSNSVRTSTSMSDYGAGDEIEFLQGKGSGKCFKIVSTSDLGGVS